MRNKRQIIELRRGIHRGDDGKIILTEEQKQQRVQNFEMKLVESRRRADRCRSEIAALGGVPRGAEDAAAPNVFEMEIETHWKPLVARLEDRERELMALVEDLRRPWWKRWVDKIRRRWNRNG